MIKNVVILSERSESKNLRTKVLLSRIGSVWILRHALPLYGGMIATGNHYN